MRRQSSYKQRKNKSGGAGTPSPGGGGGGGGNKGGARRTSKHRKKSQRSVDRQPSLSASNSDLIIPDLDDSFVMEDVSVEHDDSSSSSDPSKPRDASAMRASAIKRELKSYGVSTNSIMEKNQLVNALEEIWRQGDLPQNTEDDSDDDIVVANAEEDVPVLSDHSGDDDDEGVPALSDDEGEGFLVSKISSPPTSPLRSTTEAPTETTTETPPSPKDVPPLPSPPPPDDAPSTANEETSPPSTTLAQESLTNALDNAPALFTNDDDDSGDDGGDVIVVPTNPSRSTDDSPVVEKPTAETSPSPSSAASPSFAPLEEERSADEPPVVVEEPTENTSPSPANDDGSESPSTVPTSVSPEEVLTNVVDNAPTLFANDEEEYDAIDPPVMEPSPSTTNNDGGTPPPPVPPEEVLTNVVDNAPTLFANDDDGDGRVAPTSPSRSTEDDRLVDQSTANTETSPPSKNDEAASPLVPTRMSPDESPTSAIDDPSSAHKDVDDDENRNETVVPTSPIANDDAIDTVVPTSPLRSTENEPTANDDDKDKTVVPRGPLRATTENPNSGDDEDDKFVLRKATSPRPVRNNEKSDDDGNPGDLFILTSPSALIPPDEDDEDKDKENKTNDVSFPPPKTFSPVTTPSPKPSTDDRPSTAADEKLSTPAVRSNATSPPPPPTTNRYASPSSSFDSSPIVFQPLSQPFLPKAALNNDAAPTPPPLARANRIEGDDEEEEDNVPTKVLNPLRRSSASSSGLNLAGLWRPGSEQQLRHAPATTAVNPLQSQQQQPMLVPSFGDATTNDHDGDYVKRFVVPTTSYRRTLSTVPPTPPQDSTPRTPRTADDDESTEVGLPIDDAGGGSPFAQRPQTDWSGGDHQDFSFGFLPPSNNNVRTPWTDQAQSFDFSVPSNNNNNVRTPKADQTQSFDFSVPSNVSASFHPGGGSFREGNDDDDDGGVGVGKHRSPDFRFNFAMDKGYRKQRRSKTTPTNRRRNGDRSTPRTNAHETKGDKNETNFKFDFAVDKVAQQQRDNADERRNGDQPTLRTDKDDTKDAGKEKGTEIVGRENEEDDRINYISSLLESIKDDGGDRFDGVLDDLEGLDRATSDVDDVWKMNTDHGALNAVEHESDEEETETEEEEDSTEEERAVLAAKRTVLEEEREKQKPPSNARNLVVEPRHRKRSSALCRRHTVCEQCVVQ